MRCSSEISKTYATYKRATCEVWVYFLDVLKSLHDFFVTSLGNICLCIEKFGRGALNKIEKMCLPWTLKYKFQSFVMSNTEYKLNGLHENVKTLCIFNAVNSNASKKSSLIYFVFSRVSCHVKQFKSWLYCCVHPKISFL